MHSGILEQLKHIKAALQNQLPGVEAQRKMMPAMRLKMSLDIPENVKNGAVLILIYPKNEELCLCFIKRASDGGVHSGQISFPGGKRDESDLDFSDTALRETSEEIGVNTSGIELIGKLTNLYIPVSNYLVYPFVGFHAKYPDFKVNKSEVDEIIEVPLHYLIKPEICHISEIFVSNISYEVPCYVLEKNKIWGATAMILSEFLQVIKPSI